MNSAGLIDLLSLEQLEVNLFRGKSHKTHWGRVFGGQVLAQALHAARQTVPVERDAHSMHAYFILPGDINYPIVYQVDTIRDGRSFTTRRVVAIQHGRAIFNMAASFQVAEKGFEHQIKMPVVPAPELVKSDKEWAFSYKEEMPELWERYNYERPFEYRPVEKFDPRDPKDQEPFRHIWMKVNGRIADDPALHREVLAYGSDSNLMGTSMLPHRSKIVREIFQATSLDHGMWFHHNFRVDEWLLFVLDSPAASHTRGFNRGSFFNQEGLLVASVVQEGLIRQREPRKRD
jgi:acyl-CoA thioesterase-2